MEAAAPSPLFDSEFLKKLEQLHLLSRKIFRGQQHAERRSRQTGSSLEFADYRNYTPGDDLRTVDWNVYGRLDRLFVKLFEAEQDLSVSILVDCSGSMLWQPPKRPGNALTSPVVLSKFDHARRIVAALSYIALANLDRVNLFPFGAELGTDLGFVRGKQQFHSVLDFLKRLAPIPGETDLPRSIKTFAHRQKRRGLVFVVGDFLDPRASDGLALLRQHQFEAFAIQVLDEAEINPVASGDLKIEDVESGESLDIVATPGLLESYRAAFKDFTETLEQTCRQRAVGFIQTTTALPFEDLILQVLRERQMIQ